MLFLRIWEIGVEGFRFDFTRPGEPAENGLIESNNGRLFDDFRNVDELIVMQDERELWKALPHEYNRYRPCASLGHLSLSEFVKKRSDQRARGPQPWFESVLI